jgi:hypothetical protein
MHIFIDESGDLGFDFSKPGTSKKFTIALLVCENEKTRKIIEKAIKQTIRRKIFSSTKAKNFHELKASKTSLKVKKYFLSLMPDSGWHLYAITINKLNVKDHLKTKTGKNKLYNYLTKELLKSFSVPRDLISVNIIIDSSKTKADRKDFNAYIKTNLENTFELDTNIYITHEISQNSAGLQAVDLFCNAIWNKESNGKDEWFQLFEKKINNNIRYFYN